MRQVDILSPELNTLIKYKILDFDDVDIFVRQHRNSSKKDYILAVLETIVYNLVPDITERLKDLDRPQASAVMDTIFNGCVMLNPGLDPDAWIRIAGTGTYNLDRDVHNIHKQIQNFTKEVTRKRPLPKTQKKKITKARYLGLEHHLKERVIGQDAAIEEVVNAMKRSIVGMSDENRPLGVFLFAGASGVGKTHLAKELHKYLFGDEEDMVRIDCGEYQHKHENQKLIGSPPGYIGFDEGGLLTNSVLKSPQTVVLLDEVEKAHPDLWNTFLRIFDEGIVTDGQGRTVSFRDSIIIMTTNLGNTETVEHLMAGGVGFGGKIKSSFNDASAPVRSMVEKNTNEAIRKSFRPEFLNRIDKTVVFNHLTGDDLAKIVALEMDAVDMKLTKKGLTLMWDDSVVKAMISEGVNPVEGARGISRVRREKIENLVSDVLLKASRWSRGTIFSVTWTPDDGYQIDVRRPVKLEKAPA